MILSDKATIERYVESGVWGQTTLDAIFARSLDDHPHDLAVADAPNRADFTDGDPRRLTYAQLNAAADRVAQNLTALGLQPEDVVAVQLPNMVEAVALVLGCARAGLIVTPVPAIWREHELLKALSRIAPRAIVTCARIDGFAHGELVRDVAAELMCVRFVLGFGGDLPDGVMPLDGIFDGEGRFAPDLMTASIGANDVATVCWSGGRAPAPAPVPRSANQWIAAGLMTLLEAGIAPGSAILSAYPLTSLISIGALFMPWLLSGGALHLHQPLDLDVLARQMRDENIAYTALPPAVIADISKYKAWREARAGALACIGCVWPGPLLPDNAADIGANAARRIVDLRAFGEMAYTAHVRDSDGGLGLIPFGDWNGPQTASGGPVLMSARIKGGAVTNRTADTMLAGELMLQSPMMFDSYFPSVLTGDDEPALARDAKGFVASGLRCRLVGSERAMIQCAGRDPGVIIHGGMQISASELDLLYSEYDALADAAAFTFDDPVMGERILAAIVPFPGENISLDDFRHYLHGRKVASYKHPDRLLTVRTIPRNEQGEVLRDQVLSEV